MLLPVAVVGQAVATAALPTFARLASEGRSEELGSTLEATLRAALGLAILAAAALAVLAEPTVAVVFERGRFTAADTAAGARILRALPFAVPAWGGPQSA